MKRDLGILVTALSLSTATLVTSEANALVFEFGVWDSNLRNSQKC